MDTFINRLKELSGTLEGEFRCDSLTTTIYSTDASVYRERPVAVVWPANISDLKKLVNFAATWKTGLTMRAGGTSLAGQVVTSGIIADVSRFLNRVIEVNEEEKWVRVEPGVVLDELNMYLKPYGLFFGPETSTSNRCNIGGMVGNNACGSHSLIYGSTRDHLLEVKAILSDGSEAVFGPADIETFKNKCQLQNLEGKIYRNIKEILEDHSNQKSIREGYPDRRIHRRNTGYALDLLLESDIFDSASEHRFNFCNLLAGSEGTLAIATEIKLNLVNLPPASKALVCVHLRERNEAFRANLVALKHNPAAVEMMDNRILELTEGNLSQRENRFFLDGKPGAILIVEFARDSTEDLGKAAEALITDMKGAGFGYAWPVITGKNISKVWDLRKAGLGVLMNMKGDPKPVALIEDTAVNPDQLPDYMEDIEKMLSGYGKEAVYHAHIGSGELHLRPILNLKDPGDVQLFRKIGLDTARIVKKYNGSLSGEHGDGRLRGEFIPIILGEHNYELLKSIKKAWDPWNILNPGKITDTPSMNDSLRYIPGNITRDIKTIFDFSSSDGFIRAAERCNGSADCRKSAKIGGVMCPSFMATGDEDKTTRARANALREFLNKEGDPWNHPEIHEILDLCLGCKGCKSECPSGVDIAKMKSEYLQHWYDRHGIPVRTLMIAYIASLNKIGSLLPSVYNSLLSSRIISGIIKKSTGFAQGRSIPLIYRTSLRRWLKQNLRSINPEKPQGSVCLFIDEFTNYNDTETGIAAVRLLTSLNYKVVTADHHLSARTFISKGMLRKARKIIRRNIRDLSPVISQELPLIGIEPSAILGFRDEYPELAGADLKSEAHRIAASAYLIDEFIAAEMKSGRIDRKSFTENKADISVHAHCQQKAIASSSSTLEMLSIPLNYKVTEIPSGCCGMAGSFGYEKEHFELANKVGELVLFPGIRKMNENTIIAAPGTSCRHHIKDGTGRIALHPAEILYNALVQKEGKRK
jgi:FAD/FMN-containing dehydrogenase/Fe-S oxidoreductase